MDLANILNKPIMGVVTDVVEYGAFVSIGTMEGLIHVSQVTVVSSVL